MNPIFSNNSVQTINNSLQLLEVILTVMSGLLAEQSSIWNCFLFAPRTIRNAMKLLFTDRLRLRIRTKSPRTTLWTDLGHAHLNNSWDFFFFFFGVATRYVHWSDVVIFIVIYWGLLIDVQLGYVRFTMYWGLLLCE